ncbi:unnamed protein product [Chironomus riparius]|uniref:Dehydrogenase n=1 Tax=Chironomus riparius TaxID=315576 RepID=A0A9N9RUT1_9DIPT|nr:unnamed protein product [Chironomus riparius]
MEKWEGKLAVVTGASSGIGAVITQKFAENGINVIALARRYELIVENIRNIGETRGRIHPHRCDVSDYESIKETFKWIEDNFGTIDILINNAAIVTFSRALDESEETTELINQVINTNLNGLVHCTRKAIGIMKKYGNNSIIINIASMLAHHIPYLGFSANIYPATKFAVRGFQEMIQHELIMEKNSNIRIGNISPGIVATDMITKEMLETSPHIMPEDVANAVLYVISTPVNVNISDLIIHSVCSVV